MQNEYTPLSVFTLIGELIRCCPKKIRCLRSVLILRDHLLRMLNADADSEGFCFHGDLIFAEFKEGIACRVADRKDCRLRGNLLGFIDGYRSESAVSIPKSVTFAPKRTSPPHASIFFRIVVTIPMS